MCGSALDSQLGLFRTSRGLQRVTHPVEAFDRAGPQAGGRHALIVSAGRRTHAVEGLCGEVEPLRSSVGRRLKAEAADATSGLQERAGPTHLRRGVVRALVVVATVVALASVLAVWVHRQVLDTNVYAQTSGTLLQNPAVRTAVTNYAVDELYRRVDVSAELEKVLPKDADPFSNLAAAALRQGAYQALDRALRTPFLEGLWVGANRQAHEQFVSVVVKGGGNGVSTEGGVVRLELRPILEEATARIGLGAGLAAQIPADAGSIEVVRSGQLGVVQRALRLLDAAGWFLPLLALSLYTVAIWQARDRRRETVRDIGIGLAAGAGLLLLLVGVVRGVVLDRLAIQPDARDAAAAAWRIFTEPLRAALWVVLAIGAVALLWAALMGIGRRATAVRRSLAPYLESQGFVIGMAIAVAFVLLLAGVIDSLTRFAAFVFLAAIAGFLVVALRRLTLREFPDAEPPPLRHWLHEQWGRVSARGKAASEAAIAARANRTARSKRSEDDHRSDTQQPVPQAPSSSEATAAAPVPASLLLATGSHDDLDRLERLAELHRNDVLTDDEFTAAKARLLGL